MRPIKFKGKAVMTKVELDYHDIPNYKGWIKGSLIVDGGSYYIVGNIVEAGDDGLIHEWWAKVHPESVAQYTGLTDKNGREIYEGDEYHAGDPNITYTVVWTDTGFKGKQNGTYGSYAGLSHWQDVIEIIGNIYEDKHLLGESS